MLLASSAFSAPTAGQHDSTTTAHLAHIQGEHTQPALILTYPFIPFLAPSRLVDSLGIYTNDSLVEVGSWLKVLFQEWCGFRKRLLTLPRALLSRNCRLFALDIPEATPSANANQGKGKIAGSWYVGISLLAKNVPS